VGYPSEWLKEVLKSKPEQFKLPKWGEEKKD
jgi:dipeptidase